MWVDSDVVYEVLLLGVDNVSEWVVGVEVGGEFVVCELFQFVEFDFGRVWLDVSRGVSLLFEEVQSVFFGWFVVD